MWLDRISGHSTPSGPPTPQMRSYSPAPQRSGHLAPGPLSLRPSYSPRSSSLSLPLTPNTSSSSLPTAARIPNGSALKQQFAPPVDVPDPLDVLQEVVGLSLEKNHSIKRSAEDGEQLGRPGEFGADFDFGGLSLQEFVDGVVRGSNDFQSRDHKDCIQSVEECVHSYGSPHL